MSESYKIYTLHDPDTLEVRYVGFTRKTLDERVWGHIGDSKRRNNHRCNWIKSLVRLGKRPTILIVETVSESTWRDREVFWISHFRKIGCDLVNSCDGGLGTINPSPETRSKLSAAHRGKPKSIEHRAKLSAANLGKQIPLEIRAKMRVARNGRGPCQKARRKLIEFLEKPIVCVDTGIAFPSCKSAALELGVSPPTISRWLKTGKFVYASKQQGNNQAKEVIPLEE